MRPAVTHRLARAVRQRVAERRRHKAVERRLRNFDITRSPRRIEFGSGPYPTPGYVHVDIDRDAVDLDLLAPAHDVPLPSGWAEEIRAVHVLEHVPAGLLRATLSRWHDLLQTDGMVDIHVPNGVALAHAVLKNEAHFDRSTAWRATAGIYGYASVNPGNADDLVALRGDPQHRMLFTFPILKSLLEEAGFRDVVEPADHECRHAGPWEPYIPQLCLRVVAWG